MTKIELWNNCLNTDNIELRKFYFHLIYPKKIIGYEDILIDNKIFYRIDRNYLIKKIKSIDRHMLPYPIKIYINE